MLLGLLLLLVHRPASAQEYAGVNFVKHGVDALFEGMHAVEAADLDGDGDVDLVGATMTASEIAWWENTDGAGRAWTRHSVDENFASARYAMAYDMDGDGDQDLIGAAAVADAIYWWENTDGDATAWTPHAVTDTFDFAMYVRPADLDGDGDVDLVGAALKADAVAWWENTDGTATAWTEHLVDGAFDGARHVSPADLDGDGDVDLVGAADVGDEIVWWEQTPGSPIAWVRHPIASAFNGANAAHAADMDGDGDLDILASADAADEVVWWENADQAATWTRHTIDGMFDGAFSIYPVDIDGDGAMDVVGAAAEGDMVAWWRNASGDGTAWEEQTVEAPYVFATHICAADVDGDGDSDVIGGRFGGEVAWWENQPVTPVLPVELVRFDAMADGHTVHLSWETASETDNAGFEVQRGVEGRFYALGFVDGAGTTASGEAYTFSVSGIGAGRQLFRLKQVDFDGSVTYGPERTVLVLDDGGRHVADVYPNPFNPNAQFVLTLGAPQQVRVEVFNSMGRRVAVLHEGALEAEQRYDFRFDAGHLPGGLYLFQATGDTFSAMESALLVK